MAQNTATDIRVEDENGFYLPPESPLSPHKGWKARLRDPNHKPRSKQKKKE